MAELNKISDAATRAAILAAQIAEFARSGNKIEAVSIDARADKDEWTVSALAEAKNKPHKPPVQHKKPFSHRWADTPALARAAQARGGKAGAAAQRGTKKPR